MSRIMASTQVKLTYEIVSALLRYEPETGKLYWKSRPAEIFSSEKSAKTWNRRFAEKEAFTHSNKQGYRRGSILGKNYLAHRVIWLLVTGEWPAADVDHIHGVQAGNEHSNLRSVSHLENGRNQCIPSNNKSGVNGVYWHKRAGKWQANIAVLGKTKYLGLFDDLAAAAIARKSAEGRYGFHPNHGRRA